MLGGAFGCAQPAVSSVPAAAAAAAPGSAVERILARWDHDEHADLKAVVVRQRGSQIAARYYNGERADTLHDVRSAGKSITSLLIGIAVDRGRIGSLSDPVGRYLQHDAGPIGAVTLDNILTMRVGIDADDEDANSPGNEDALDRAPDPVAFALSVPAREPQGRRYVYNSVAAYVAGMALEGAVGRSEDEYARDHLFSPLGIVRWHWQRDAAGRTKGQGNLSLTAADFAKLGQLVLDGGVYEGRRVVSQQWIDDSLAPRVVIANVDPYADGYGYFWYSKTHEIGGQRVRVYFASGNGGNKIYVVPSRALVVAITSAAYGRGYGQRRSEAILKELLAGIPAGGSAGAPD